MSRDTGERGTSQTPMSNLMWLLLEDCTRWNEEIGVCVHAHMGGHVNIGTGFGLTDNSLTIIDSG